MQKFEASRGVDRIGKEGYIFTTGVLGLGRVH